MTMPSLPQNLKKILEEKNATLGAPEGYKIISGKVPSKVVKKAVEILNNIHGDQGLYYGYEEKFVGDDAGNEYLAKIEPHYDNHPKGGGDPFWHIGVTVYEPIEKLSSE